MKNQTTICNLTRFDLFSVIIRYLLILPVLTDSPEILANTLIDDKDETTLIYDEIPVRVIAEGYNSFLIDVLYTDKKLLYIDIAELFSSLNIAYQTGKKANTLTGFIENENRTYLIDYDKKIIKIGDNTIQTATGLIKTKGILYLESSLFKESFGISLEFNYRALTIQVKSKFELPLNKQKRIEKTHNNLNRLKGEMPPDTILQRNYHLIKFGTLDWAVSSTQTENALNNNQLKLSVGSELLFGEAEVTVNHYTQRKFDNRQLYYNWHWVDNDQTYIRQAQLGILSSPSIAFINAPVIGACIRNTPTTVRKATGYYSINDYTSPNRDVELYINNILVDYTKADASGLYQFKVPIVYGYTTVKLKFYGPMGEEKTIERIMNIPYSIMPAKEFEYGLSSGVVEDSLKSRFARADLNYGVNRHLTVGGGVEYLSSITTGTKIPFLTATFQPFNKLILNAEFAQGVRTRGQINGYFKNNLFFEVEYTRYVAGQRATLIKALDEKKARLSVPFNLNKIRGFLRFDYLQLDYDSFKYIQSNVLISAYYKLTSVNSSTQIIWTTPGTSFILSDLALFYRPGGRLTISPAIQIDPCKKTLVTYKLTLEKQFAIGDFSLSYEKRVLSRFAMINLNFNYDLKFARTAISVSQQKPGSIGSENSHKGSMVISESAQGSMAFGRGKGYIYKSNNTSIGRGGVSFYLFFDQNQNGKIDKGETMVGISPERYQGNKITTEKDSLLSFADLTPFSWYTIEFKNKDLDNIGWRFSKNRYRIMVDPNQFKRVDVPVVPLNEVTGSTWLTSNDQTSGLGKIKINFYDQKNNKKIGEILSQKEGYFNYSGLEPGEYIAMVDSLQLEIMDLTSSPNHYTFTIKSQRDGDQVDKIDFALALRNNYLQLANGNLITVSDSTLSISKSGLHKMAVLPEKYSIQEAEKPFDINRLIFNRNKRISIFTHDTVITPKQTILYDVRLYTSHQPIQPGDLFTQLIARVPGIRVIEIVGKDGLYHYSTGVFLNREGAYEYYRYIREKGWIFGYIDIYRSGKQRVITFNFPQK